MTKGIQLCWLLYVESQTAITINTDCPASPHTSKYYRVSTLTTGRLKCFFTFSRCLIWEPLLWNLTFYASAYFGHLFLLICFEEGFPAELFCFPLVPTLVWLVVSIFSNGKSKSENVNFLILYHYRVAIVCPGDIGRNPHWGLW